MFHIFGHLKSKKHATITFDDQQVIWHESSFHKHNLSDFFCDAKEILPLHHYCEEMYQLVSVDLLSLCHDSYANLLPMNTMRPVCNL